MSSNITIIRICEFCKNEFVAKTTVTRYCSHNCNRKAYKEKIKTEKIRKSNVETYQTKTEDFELVRNKEFLTVKDMVILLNCSRQSIYKMVNEGRLKKQNLGIQKIIVKRSDLDKVLKNE